MRLVGSCLLVGLGVIVTYSAVQHLDHPFRFLIILRRYELVTGVSAVVFAAVLPVLQLGLGLLLISLKQPRVASFGAVLLFMAFAIAQATVLIKRLNIECGCFPAVESQVSAYTLGRTCILAVVAGMCFLIFSRRSAVPPTVL